MVWTTETAPTDGFSEDTAPSEGFIVTDFYTTWDGGLTEWDNGASFWDINPTGWSEL